MKGILKKWWRSFRNAVSQHSDLGLQSVVIFSHVILENLGSQCEPKTGQY